MSGRTQFTSTSQTIKGTDTRYSNNNWWRNENDPYNYTIDSATSYGYDDQHQTPASEYGFSASSFTAPILDGITDFSFHTKSSSFKSWVGPINFGATLNLVRENGENQILASPVIVMGDHTESLIRVGDATPVPLVKRTERDTASSSYTDYEVDWIQVISGHTLWVCPEITADGQSVRLSVHPQVTEITELKENWPTAQDGSKFPPLETRELDTRVSVPSGQTLLLGGLIQSRNSVIHKKIWLLGDIPFLGRLFRWDSHATERKNLIILIRPTILDETLDTGFEKPALKMIAPLEKGVGRDLRLPERDTKLEDNETALIRFFSRKDGEEVEVDPTAADTSEPEKPAATSEPEEPAAVDEPKAEEVAAD